MKTSEKKLSRVRRHRRVRAKVSGSKLRPRLSVFRSGQNLHLQLIDDDKAETLFSASTREVKEKMPKIDQAKAAGKLLAEKAVKGGLRSVVFDRGGFAYHGRVKAAAEGAREAGLKF